MNDPVVPVSGYYYANKLGRLYLETLEAVMDRNGLNALLNLTAMSHYIQRFPADNLERNFDFAYISNLNRGLETLYGPRGGRGLALRSGRVFFGRGLKQFGLLVGMSDLALRALPVQTKLRLGLHAIARVFTQISDQGSYVEDRGAYFEYRIAPCPICWGRETKRPIDYFTVGFLQEASRWMSGGLDFRVTQTKSISMGDAACLFRIDKEPIK